jgi:hypothetical protein
MYLDLRYGGAGQQPRPMSGRRLAPVVRRIALLVAALAIANVPALAARTHHARRLAITVSPAAGSSSATFAVSFRTRDAASAATGRYYTVDATGPAGGSSACGASGERSVTSTRAHARVTVMLSAAGSAHHWCSGTYRGTVEELQRPVCAAGTPCPQYIILLRRLGRFSFRVQAGGDRTAPTFAGLESAFACTPGPQRPGQTTPFTLTWMAATDNVTPSNEIVYDVYESGTSGGENYAQPNWTTAPGATTFRAPGLPSHGSFYFVVRARDQAGNEDQNTVERHGVDPCL